jgi:hypothetical protein
VGTGRRAPEEVIKSDDPVNLRARQVQLLGDHGDRSSRNVAKSGLDGVQYFEERTRSLTVLRHDVSDGGSLLGR